MSTHPGDGKRRLVLAALFFGSALIAASPALGQDDPAAQLPPTAVRRADPRSAFARELLRAQQLIKRDPEGAYTQLKALAARAPENPEAQFLLARAGRVTGRLVEAEQLLRDLRRRYPEAQGYVSELALVLLRAGKDEEAKAFLAMLYREGPPRAGAYEAAASLLLDQARPDLVEAIYREGLTALPRADEPGRLRLLRRLFEFYNLVDAPAKLLRALAEASQSFQDASLREELLREGELFLGETRSPADLLPMADSLAASPAGPRLSPVLRQIYLGVGDHARFAEQALRTPLPGGERGHWLYSEGLRCLEDMDRGGPASAARRRSAADRLFSAGLAEAKSNPSLRAMLRYQLARLRLEADAEARLAGRAPAPERARTPAIEAALELELGETLLAAQRFAEAKGHYASLLRPERGASRPAALAAWASFRLAELLVIDGNLQAAQDSLSALAEADPGAALANDALDLALLLAESAAWPETVRAHLLAALQREFGGNPAGAAAALLEFAATYPEDAASPALLYRAGQLELRALRGEPALAAWLLLADRHPEDPRAPQALEQAARLAHRLGDAPRARALLARILEEHPDFRLRPSLRDLQDRLKEEGDV